MTKAMTKRVFIYLQLHVPRTLPSDLLPLAHLPSLQDMQQDIQQDMQ